MPTLPPWLARSTTGSVMAGIYVVLAVVCVLMDRYQNSGGNFITLRGIATYIITLPVSLPGEMLGSKLDYRRNLDMLFAIVVCALLVYVAGAGLAKLTAMLFSGASAT